MKEWSNPYSPFNSFKVLLNREHLEAIVAGNFLHPVQVDIDPSNRCNYKCPHCLPKGSLVLNDRWEYIAIESLRKGDYIVGFENEENRVKGKHLPLVRIKITEIMQRKAKELVRIVTDKGELRVTPDHKVWESRGRWKYAKNFKAGDFVKSLGGGSIESFGAELKRGWLSGVADGDGCFWSTIDKRKEHPTNRRQFRIAVQDEEILRRFELWTGEFGFRLYRGKSSTNGEWGSCVLPALFLTKHKEVVRFEKWLLKEGGMFYKRGWLGGIFDTDGSNSGYNLRIFQEKCHSRIRDRIGIYFNNVGFAYKEEKKGYILLGGVSAKVRFFNLCKPVLERKKNKLFGTNVSCAVKVERVEKIQYNEMVYDLETESHNFIANGIKVHNCNAWEARTRNPGHMTEEHLIDIATFCGEWGIKGACVSGGGEPLLNEGTGALLLQLKANEIESGVITNGSLLEGKVADIIVDCSRWCGISMDAVTPETYNKIKGLPKDSDMFWEVVNNIENLVARKEEKGTYLDVAFKFLIHPNNVHEIYDAAKLARELGVKHFHARPCGFDNVKGGKRRQQEFIALVDIVNEQFERMFELENGYFEVFGVRHKFKADFTRKVNFSKCWAIPLIVTFAAGGDLELCFDRRGDESLVMTNHLNLDNVKKYWNSPEHHKLIDSIDVQKCPRCFRGDVKITTSDGIKEIKEVEVGDMVLTHRGRFRKVIRLYRRRYKGLGRKLKLYGNTDAIVCDDDHPFYGIQSKRCCFSYKNIFCIDGCNYKKWREKYCRSGCKEYYKQYKVEWIKSRDVETKKSFLEFPKIAVNSGMESIKISDFLGETLDYEVEDGKVFLCKGRKNQRKYIKNEVILKDFLKLGGYYLAEGWTKKDGIALSFNKNEQRYIKDVIQLMEKVFSVSRVREYGRGNVIEVACESYILRDLFKNIFGTGARNKKIPEWIFYLDKELIGILLRHYWMGDGNYHSDVGINISTSSRDLAYQVRILFAKCGFITRVNKGKARIGTIEGRAIRDSGDVWTIVCGKKRSEAEQLMGIERQKMINTREACTVIETEKSFQLPVREAEEIDLDEELYNLEVEEDNSYVVENVAVHNCTFGIYNEMIEQVIIKDGMCKNFP